MTSNEPPRQRFLRRGSYALGLLGLAFAWRFAAANDLAAFWSVRAAVAVVLAMLGYLCIGASYGLLGPPMKRTERMVAYVRSLPAKYLPGGVFQPVVQAGLGGAGATADTLTHALLTLSGGAMLSVFAVGLDPPWRYAAFLVAVLGLALGARPVLVRFRSRLARWKGSPVASLPPTRRALVPATLGMVLLGFSFAILPSDGVRVSLVGVFALAWTAGFVMWFLPGGLGAREAVLAFLAGPLVSHNSLSLALSHRMVTLLAEVALMVLTWLVRPLSGHGAGDNRR